MSNKNGSWKSISYSTSHFVPDGSATSLCELVTLDIITDQKWDPPGAEGHLCGKCRDLGADPPSGGCPCPVCKNPTLQKSA